MKTVRACLVALIVTALGVWSDPVRASDASSLESSGVVAAESQDLSRAGWRLKRAIALLTPAYELCSPTENLGVDYAVWKEMQKYGLMQYAVVARELQKLEPNEVMAIFKSLEGPAGYDFDEWEKRLIAYQDTYYKHVAELEIRRSLADQKLNQESEETLLKLWILNRLLYDVPPAEPGAAPRYSVFGTIEAVNLFPLTENNQGELTFVDEWWQMVLSPVFNRAPSEEQKFFAVEYPRRDLSKHFPEVMRERD